MLSIATDRLRGRAGTALGLELTPLRITGVYLTFSAGLLYAFDVVLPALVSTQELLVQLQFAKGFVEIAVTAGLIYVLTARARRSMQATTDHLEAAQQELSFLHRILRHNLRNELTVVTGHADMLDDELDSPRLTEHCDVIRENCDSLLTSAEKATLLAELDGSEVGTTDVDVGATLDRVLDRLDHLRSAADVSVSLPADATVEAHGSVEFALQELVENAIVHNDGATSRVSVTVDDAPEYEGWRRVRVDDDGPGIPDAEVERLTQHEKPLAHASGVGLWVSAWIVYKSGGDFAIENTGRGCRVTVTLPTPAVCSQSRAEAALDDFFV